MKENKIAAAIIIGAIIIAAAIIAVGANDPLNCLYDIFH